MKGILAIVTLLFCAGVAHAAKANPTALEATIAMFDSDRAAVTEKIHEVRNAVLDSGAEGQRGTLAKEKVDARIKAINQQFGWHITSAGDGDLCFPSGAVFSMRNWESFSAKGPTPNGVAVTSYFETKPAGKVNFDDGDGHYIVMQVSPSDVQVTDANLPLPADSAQRLFLMMKMDNKAELSQHLTRYFRACAGRTDTNFYTIAISLLKVPAQREDFRAWLLNAPTISH